jgi:hypothetical protein
VDVLLLGVSVMFRNISSCPVPKKLYVNWDTIVSFVIVDLIEPKPPSLSFSPAAIKHIQEKLKRLGNIPTNVNAAYERILDIFVSHGQERKQKNKNSAE